MSIYLPKLAIKMRILLTKEAILIMSIAFCLLISMISVKEGLSPALGAFITGMILAGTTEFIKIKTMLLPIRDLFVAIFFVSVGMIKVSVLPLPPLLQKKKLQTQFLLE